MTKVKICGIQNINEAKAAKNAGAWAIGQVFASSSRLIKIEDAAKINFELGKSIIKIGVFVNEDIGTINKIAKECSLDMVQLHGDESPEYTQELQMPVIKAMAVKHELESEEVMRWRAWAYLFDTYNPKIRGGSGESFNWDYLKNLRGIDRIILAGGLNSTNIIEAIDKISPFAVDVSSAVEYPQGGKDEVKIKEFMSKVKEAKDYVS